MLIVRAKHARVCHRVENTPPQETVGYAHAFMAACGKRLPFATTTVLLGEDPVLAVMAAGAWCKKCHPLAGGVAQPLWKNLKAAFWYGRWYPRQPDPRRGRYAETEHWTLRTAAGSAVIERYDGGLEDDEDETSLFGTGPFLAQVHVTNAPLEQRRWLDLVAAKAWALSRLRYYLNFSLDVVGHAEVLLDGEMERQAPDLPAPDLPKPLKSPTPTRQLKQHMRSVR